jgi:hypothetical protein
MSRAHQSLLLVLLLAIGCTTSTGPGPSFNATGDWGGPDANLTLTTTGGSVEYGCGLAVIASSWTVTPAGVFTATGQHFTEGGPAPIGGTPPHPARFNGQVHGTLLTFTETLTDLQQTLGPFTVERGKTFVLVKCL